MTKIRKKTNLKKPITFADLVFDIVKCVYEADLVLYQVWWSTLPNPGCTTTYCSEGEFQRGQTVDTFC